MNLSPILLTDGYKLDHRRQYPNNTTVVYSNFTPRKSRRGSNRVVMFGLQYFIKEYLQRSFNDHFFCANKQEVLENYTQRLSQYFGPNNIGVEHIADLWDLGYLPIEINAVPEGTSVQLNHPMMTIHNTKSEFFWLTNYLETLISNVLWMPCTSATTSRNTFRVLDQYSDETCENGTHMAYQAHDFSMRGMASVEASMLSAAAHLIYFFGTDTFPVLDWLPNYYDVESNLGNSVPASEHSVMCMNTDYSDGPNDFTAVTRMLDLYDTGIVSIVADTFDYFRLLTDYLPQLKDRICARDGKVVLRPDSGVPNLIINGDPNGETEPERAGSLEILGKIFGTTTNAKGYKVLNPKIGLIYGDGCNLDTQREILENMKKRGWASSNIVFGTGSYAYQYVTRDTEGFAMKATYGEKTVEGAHGSSIVRCNIFKDPATDKNKLKKSHKGLLKIDYDDQLHEEVTWDDIYSGKLQTVYQNGHTIQQYSFDQVRKNAMEEVDL